MPGARQKLAQILKTTFEDKDVSDTQVSQRCKTTVKSVEQWKEGSLVPNTGEWSDLLQYISRDLYMHTNLWRDAKEEEITERRDTIRALDRAQRIGEPEIPSTNVGQKIKEQHNVPATAPTAAMRHLGQTPKGFAKDGRLLCPARPNGSMSLEAQRDRRRFVKGLLLQRPSIRVGGEDGIQALLRKRFGIGIDPRIIPELKAEIEQEHQGYGLTSKNKSLECTTEVTSIKPRISEPSPKDLEAAVELILGALPDLHQFVLTVDEKTREVSVEYKVMKIVDGSIKIKAAK